MSKRAKSQPVKTRFKKLSESSNLKRYGASRKTSPTVSDRNLQLASQVTLPMVQAVLAEKSLYEFTRQAWNILEPATEFIDGWHIGCISEYLEAVTLGQINRLIINVPPRYMKSLNVSVCWPAWEWGPRNMPHLRYLFSSYAGELSTKHSVDRRTLIESDWYQRNWGNRFQLVSDNNRKTEFENDRRGVMSTTSTGSAATGKGGNRVIVDDPLNPKEAVSDTERENANTHFDQTLYSRLNDKKRDPLVVIMQRLHTRDLTGHLLAKKDHGYTHLCLEAESEKRKVITFPISKKKVERKIGDILWPEREPKDVLEATKVALGTYAYSGQYQQSPAPLEGGVVKRDWWRRYDTTQRPVSFHQLFISADPKFKDYETSSHVAIHLYGVIGPNIYLLERIYNHLGCVETINGILKMRLNWTKEGHSVGAVLIEDKANGPAIIQILQKRIPGIIAVEPDGDKIARALAASPIIEAGNVWIPNEPWGDEVIDAWSFVPNGDNWDDVDAASQAIRYFSRRLSVDSIAVVAANEQLGNMESADANW